MLDTRSAVTRVLPGVDFAARLTAGAAGGNNRGTTMDDVSGFFLAAWEQYPWATAAAAAGLALLAFLRPKEFGKLLLAAGAIAAVIYVVMFVIDTVRIGSEGREQLTRDPHVQVEPGQR